MKYFDQALSIRLQNVYKIPGTIKTLKVGAKNIPWLAMNP